MSDIGTARKVIQIAKDLTSGVETTRDQILDDAGRERHLQLKNALTERLESGTFSILPEAEANLQVSIIAALDQMSRRMPWPLPDGEIQRVKSLIEELDQIRSSRERLPVSPGISIWRGELLLRQHDYRTAFEEFSKAISILEPMIGQTPSVPPTLVAALSEAAYSLSMLAEEERSISYSDNAISVARENCPEEAKLIRILREYFVAGNAATLPLATAYMSACDVRVNLLVEWDTENQLTSDFKVYWNLLNDECGGLLALEVPHLIAILSDKNWMGLRPDLSAPIARALFMKTSKNIPHALWRKANLFFGGFRFGEKLSNAANSNSSRAAAAILAAALVGYGTVDSAAGTLSELNGLAAGDIATFFGTDGSATPSGSEIVSELGIDVAVGSDVAAVGNILFQDLANIDTSSYSFEIATANSSLVGADLV